MEFTNVVNVIRDLVWLDEAFAKGIVDDLEAACCLAGYSQEGVLINSEVPNIYNLYPVDIHYPKVVRKVYELIMTWDNVTRCKPLLWYIEQAVVKNAPYVRYDLLLPKCKENKHRQKECIDKYPELAEKLGLTPALPTAIEKSSEQEGQSNTNSTDNKLSLPFGKSKEESLILPLIDEMAKKQEPSKKVELPWVPNAVIIFKELRPGRENLSLEQMAKLIEKEMQKRHDAGEENMAKRGSKKAPSFETIRRYALNGL